MTQKPESDAPSSENQREMGYTQLMYTITPFTAKLSDSYRRICGLRVASGRSGYFVLNNTAILDGMVSHRNMWNIGICLWNGTKAPQHATCTTVGEAGSYLKISRHATNYTHIYRCRAIRRTARMVKCNASKGNNVCVCVVLVPERVRPAPIHGSYVNVKQNRDHVLRRAPLEATISLLVIPSLS